MEELTCKSVCDSLWDFIAGLSEEPVRLAIAAHLAACRECESHRREVTALQCGLKQLPAVQVPGMLTTRLLVSASRERSRREASRDFGTWLRGRKARFGLFVDNLLKPFAVPAAGGILASFLCFGMIVDSLHVSTHWDSSTWDNDIPLGMFTEIAIDELSPFTCDGRDVVVQLTVDAHGDVTDYAMPNATPSHEDMQEIGNLVLYSSFTPATRFGQPISSKRLFFIRHVSVRG